MARPRTALGTSGSLKVVGQAFMDGRWVTAPDGVKPTRWRARTKFRDSDGVLRDVERFDATRSRAQMALKAALVERKAPARTDVLRADMSILDAGSIWLAQVGRPDSGLSDNTRVQYAASFDRYLRGSSIAGLTLREVNRVSVLEAYLRGIADDHGPGAAKTARSIISNIITLAVRYKVLDYNATREVKPAQAFIQKGAQRDTTRALTRAERDYLLTVADECPQAIHADVSDVVWFLAGTGVRISEALGQRWDDIDVGAATAHVRGTKTEASDRRLSLPPWLNERLTARSVLHGREGLVFASPAGRDRDKPRDRRNVARVFRQVFDEAGFPWATPHTLRRTVATLLDEAGLPIALAANQLGHANPAMTARVYLGRKGDMSAAAAVL